MESKKPYLSKTIIFNFLVAALGLFGYADKFSPAQIMSFLGVVGIALRFITKDKIVLVEKA